MPGSNTFVEMLGQKLSTFQGMSVGYQSFHLQPVQFGP